jgi:hypothetical protein
MRLSAEELLAGSGLTYEVAVPPGLLQPGQPIAADEERTVRLRPLTVRDLQLILRAAKESDALTATLMVQRALLEPELSLAEVTALPIGLVQFLLEQISRLSGLETTADQLEAAAEAPLVRAAFLLARSFGWTPAQVSELTLGQMLLHLELLKEQSQP